MIMNKHDNFWISNWKKNTSLFPRSKFQKSPSLRENGHFLKKNETFFWTKKQRFFHVEKSVGSQNWTRSRIDCAESFNANPMALAVKVLKILSKNHHFLKSQKFSKKFIFLKNYWSDRAETWHVGARDNSVKNKFEQMGSL